MSENCLKRKSRSNPHYKFYAYCCCCYHCCCGAEVAVMPDKLRIKGPHTPHTGACQSTDTFKSNARGNFNVINQRGVFLELPYVLHLFL